MDTNLQDDRNAAIEVSWHLNKNLTISILGLLITIAIALITISAQGLWFAAKMDERVHTLEEQRKADLLAQETQRKADQLAQQQRDDRQDKAVVEADNQQLAYLIRMEKKIDDATLAIARALRK